MIENFGELTFNTCVVFIVVFRISQTVGIKTGFVLSLKHDVMFNAQVIVSVVHRNSVFITVKTFLSLIINGSVNVVRAALILNVIQRISAHSSFQNEISQTLVALISDSLNTIFRGRDQFALIVVVQKVFVMTLSTGRLIQVNGAVGDFFNFLAMSFLLKQETLIVAISTNVSQSRVINLTIGNDIVRFTESVFEIKFVLTHLANV